MPISEVERTLAGQSKVPIGGETNDDDEDPEVDDMY